MSIIVKRGEITRRVDSGKFNQDFPLFYFHFIDGDFLPWRAVQTFPGGKLKSPVMKRANDRVVLKNPSSQWPTQMRAGIVESKDAAIGFVQRDFTALDFDNLHAVVGEGGFFQYFPKRGKILGGH